MQLSESETRHGCITPIFFFFFLLNDFITSSKSFHVHLSRQQTATQPDSGMFYLQRQESAHLHFFRQIVKVLTPDVIAIESVHA